MQEVFAQHLDLSAAELETLLTFNLEDFLDLPQTQDLLNSLDVKLLKETFPTAASALAERLPLFYNWLKNELELKRVPDSPEHTTKWVLGFLNNQESLTHLVDLHRPVPQVALERSIPRLVATFDGVEDEQVRGEWQKAIALICLVIIIGVRDNSRLLQFVG